MLIPYTAFLIDFLHLNHNLFQRKIRKSKCARIHTRMCQFSVNKWIRFCRILRIKQWLWQDSLPPARRCPVFWSTVRGIALGSRRILPSAFRTSFCAPSPPRCDPFESSPGVRWTEKVAQDRSIKVDRLRPEQCDQIGRFLLMFGQLFTAYGNDF